MFSAVFGVAVIALPSGVITASYLDELREEKKLELDDKMPKVNFTPYVALENLDDSALVLVVRAWCLFADYWGVLYDINEAVYKQLPANGVQFPFPQLDVHIKNQ